MLAKRLNIRVRGPLTESKLGVISAHSSRLQSTIMEKSRQESEAVEWRYIHSREQAESDE